MASLIGKHQSLFNKVSGQQPAAVLKGDSDSDVFLWMFWNVPEQHFAEHP